MTICAFNLSNWQFDRYTRWLRYVHTLQYYVARNDIQDGFIFSVLSVAENLLKAIVYLGEQDFTPEGQAKVIELYDIFENLPDLRHFVFGRSEIAA